MMIHPDPYESARYAACESFLSLSLACPKKDVSLSAASFCSCDSAKIRESVLGVEKNKGGMGEKQNVVRIL